MGKKGKINTLAYLNSGKERYSKVKHITHSVLDMQDCLKPNDLSIKESKFTFAARSRMVDIRGNHSGQQADTLHIGPIYGVI